jgi:hypothetical protein
MRACILALGCACVIATPTLAAPAPRDVTLTRDVTLSHQVEYRYDRGHGRGRWGYGPDCRELRRACLFKEDLGEVGRGNCQRYRALCR